MRLTGRRHPEPYPRTPFCRGSHVYYVLSEPDPGSFAARSIRKGCLSRYDGAPRQLQKIAGQPMKIPIAIHAAPAALLRYLRCIRWRIWTAICLAAAGLIGLPSSLRAATPAGTSLISTIELSPGGSAYSPGQFGFNQATHKLYTLAPYRVNLQPC